MPRQGARWRGEPAISCIADSWPGQMRTVYGDHHRFVEPISRLSGQIFYRRRMPARRRRLLLDHGPRRRRHQRRRARLGTAEVESALVAHPKVAEAAVVGYPHDIKGQGIYAYVTLMTGEQPTEELRKELVDWVRKEIGPIASPDLIQFAPGLPKTRSGKIMRRILRKIAEDDSAISATPRRWPTPPWSTIWSITGRTRARRAPNPAPRVRDDGTYGAPGSHSGKISENLTLLPPRC